MSSRQSRTPAADPRGAPPTDDQLLALGKLSFLAAYCPLHRSYPGHLMSAIFFPAVSNGCVRFFENDQGATAAALIWARLSEEVAVRMLSDGRPPSTQEWVAGDQMWFIDLLAPFGHGRIIARTIARNPPPEPFYFARLDGQGRLAKIVEGDPTRGRRGFVGARRMEAA